MHSVNAKFRHIRYYFALVIARQHTTLYHALFMLQYTKIHQDHFGKPQQENGDRSCIYVNGHSNVRK